MKISPQKYDKEYNEMVNRFNTKKYANKKLILPQIKARPKSNYVFNKNNTKKILNEKTKK